MIPHIFGFFPYTACWVVYFSSFITSLQDAQKENEDLYDDIPDFVIPAVAGTFLWFSLFVLPQWRWQYVSPGAHRRRSTMPQTIADTRVPFIQTTTGRPRWCTAPSRWAAS